MESAPTLAPARPAVRAHPERGTNGSGTNGASGARREQREPAPRAVHARLASVIVLNFNGEKIIRKCLDHLFAQTYSNFEIIVVDNGSTDGSLRILEGYLRSGPVSVVRSPKNLGVPGGRNLGLLYAEGDVVAFMDNDGYADPNWLAEAVRTLESDERVGAVASVVFFAQRKIILNGAGGTLNLLGYGGDHCFNGPYEFASLPREVLYPMGCGMVIRRSVMDRIGPLDARLFNYYDDAELGIRTWKAGFRVVVAPDAWVDHQFSYSDRLLKNKVYLCERNRIRTVLKYYPPRRLLSWILREWRLVRYLRLPGLRSVPVRAWAWNLGHLGSVLGCRLRFGFGRDGFWNLLHPSWGVFPPVVPNNQQYRPDPDRATSRLHLDGATDEPQLNYGWYWVEGDGIRTYRHTQQHASALFRLERPTRRLVIAWRPLVAGQRVRAVLRRLGDIEPVWQAATRATEDSWQEWRHPCRMGAGTYELLLLSDCARERSGRAVGIAVSSIAFG